MSGELKTDLLTDRQTRGGARPYEHQEREENKRAGIGIVNKRRGDRAGEDISQKDNTEHAYTWLSAPQSHPTQSAQEREEREEDQRPRQREILDGGAKCGEDVGRQAIGIDDVVIVQPLGSRVYMEQLKDTRKGITAVADLREHRPLLRPIAQPAHVADEVDRCRGERLQGAIH